MGLCEIVCSAYNNVKQDVHNHYSTQAPTTLGFSPTHTGARSRTDIHTHLTSSNIRDLFLAIQYTMVICTISQGNQYATRPDY